MAKKKAVRGEWASAQFYRAAEHGKEPHEIIQPLIARIAEDQSSRYEAYKEFVRAYGGDLSQFGDEFQSTTDASVFSDEIEQNELANSIETLHAQIFKDRVIPAVSVSEADYEEFSRAKGFSRWMEGVFEDAEVHDVAVPQAGADMLVYGTGMFLIGHEMEDEQARITVDRLCPRYVFVDRLGARDGRPRSIHVKVHVDRWQLLDELGCDDKSLFGSAKNRYEKIAAAPGNDDLDANRAGSINGDMVTVWKSWHLPNSKGEDGRYCVTIRDCTLIDRPYKRKRFPVVPMRFNISLAGYYGESAVKRLLPLQRAFDKMVKRVDRAHDLLGIPRLIVQKGRGLKPSQIDDIEGAIYEVDGSPREAIQEWNPQPITPDAYSERDGLPGRMRGTLGISQFEASQGLPPQMRDVGAPFLERMVDQGVARHAMNHRQYARAMVQIGEVCLDEAEELEELGIDVVSKAKGEMKSSIDILKFCDVKVDRRHLKLFIQPSGNLPQTFAGKVDALSKLSQVPPEHIGLLEIPDVHGESDMKVSMEEIVKKTLTAICKQKRYIPPMPWDNLDVAKVVTMEFISLYRIRHDVEDDTYMMLLNFLQKLEEMAAPVGQPMGGAPVGPDGMPLPPPGPAMPPPGLPPEMMGGMPPEGQMQ
jgi:hypothetical protein